MSEQVSIRLRIADREYKLKVPPEAEPLYRQAGKQLAERVEHYRRTYQNKSVDLHYLTGMAAIACLTEALDAQQSAQQAQQQLHDKLHALDQYLESQMPDQ